MAYRHLANTLILAGTLRVLFGAFFFSLKIICTYGTIVRECSSVGSKHMFIIPGILSAAFGWILHAHKDNTLSDVESILRYHEIDAHCPRCYTQGIVKSNGMLFHKMSCPKCGRSWRILDL